MTIKWAQEDRERLELERRQAAERYQNVTTVFPPKAPTILGTQIGGDHYTKHAIQPIEYIWANNISFSEGNIIKYVTRWKSKGGIKDLEKAAHHCNLLIEWAHKQEANGVKYGAQRS